MPIAPNPNDHLTARWKRTLRELDNDPRDWFEAPGREPDQVEVQLKQQPRPFTPVRPANEFTTHAPAPAPATSGPPRLPRWRRTRPWIAASVLVAWLAVFLAVLFHKL